MVTVEAKIIQLLEAKSHAVDEYIHVVHDYVLKRGTNSDKLFDTNLRRSLSYDELKNSSDTNPYLPRDVLQGLQHLVEQDRVEEVIINGCTEYQYKRL